MSVGKRLKLLRINKGLTQQEAAEALNLSNVVLSYYERDKRYLDTEVLKKLASFYNVSADYLIGLESDNTEENPKHPLEDIIYDIDIKSIPDLDKDSATIIKMAIENSLQTIKIIKNVEK